MGAFLAFGHGFEQLFRGVLGVAGHEADEKIPRNVVDHADQIGEVHAAVQILAVGIHVLPQQGDVLIALIHQLPGLSEDVLRQAGALPAPHIGHNAVGAEVVAAVHDGKPRLYLPVPAEGDALGHGAGAVPGSEYTLVSGHHLLHKLRETPKLMGAEDQIHHRVGLFDLLRHMGLLHHAAADGNDLFRLVLFRMVQGTHIAQHPHLRVLPDGAGVHHDDIRLKFVLGEAVAHFGQIAPQLFAVRLVLLAAVGVHHGQRPPAPVGNTLKDPGADLLLGLDLLYIDNFSFFVHGLFP